MSVTTDTGPFAMVPDRLLYAEVSANAVKLFAILWRYADRNGENCHPGRPLMAERMGCSLPTVDRTIKELEALGAIAVRPRYDPENGHQSSNDYHLLMRGGRKDEAIPLITGEANPLVMGDARSRTSKNENQIERKEEVATAAAIPMDEELVSSLTRLWESATGSLISSLFAEWLAGQLEEGFPLRWLEDAIRETGDHGSKSPAYTKAIVQRWKSEGRDAERPDMMERFGAPKPNGFKAPTPEERAAYLKAKELFE